MRLIKYAEYKKSLWKNGQGCSDEIAIFPPTALFPDDQFLWRLSSAKINSNTHFSVFKDYDRALTVVKGAGVVLNDSYLSPLTVLQFAGETQMTCHLVADEVVDLGLIYKKELVTASMSVKTFTANEQQHVLNLADGTHFFYCVNGAFSVNEAYIQEHDTLQINGPSLINVGWTQPVTYVHVKICDLVNKPEFCKNP